MKKTLGQLVDAVTALLGRGLGAMGQLLLTLVLGRLYGADGAGVLMLGVTVVIIGSTLGRLGMEYTLLKLASQAFGEKRADRFWGISMPTLRIVALASVSTSLLIGAMGVPLIRLYLPDQRLLSVLPWFLAALPVFSLVVLFGELLKAGDRPGSGNMISTAVIPLAFSAWCLTVATWNQPNLNWAAAGYLVSTLLALSCGAFLVTRRVPLPALFATMDLSELWRPVRSLLWFSVLSVLNNWIPLLAISVFATSDDWGRYGAATRFATAVSFVLWASNSMVPPRFARLHSANNPAAMQALASRVSFVMTLAACVPVLLLVFGGKWLLGWMGEDFLAASTALTILALGQWFSVAAGSVDYLLVVTGHEVELRRGATISACSNLILCAILIPQFGITGGAIAGASSIVIERFWYCWAAWKHTGIVTLPIPDKLLNRRHLKESW